MDWEKWAYCCDVVMIKHNSVELQNKLLGMGYYALRWTVCDNPEQKLFASGRPYRKRITVREYEEHPGAFWNGGVAPVHNQNETGPRDNVIYVGDDEEMFLMYAKRLITENEIYFDKDKNEVKQ